MKTYTKKISLTFILFSIVIIFSTLCFFHIYTHAKSLDDKANIKRDTSISIDSSGKLTIHRNEIKNTSTMGKEDTWTIFMYVCGSDLEAMYGSASDDFREICSAKICSQNINNVNIIIQTGGSPMWRTHDIDSRKSQRFIIKSISGVELIEETTPQNMGDAETLSSFLEWGVNNYPAEHMSVVLWNHGTGVSNGLCTDIMFDNDSLSLPELEYAFSKVSKNMTSKFEFIGFDACLSGSIEYANILAPYANYMVASAETEPGTGWNYQPLIDHILNNPDSNGFDVCKIICDSYYNTNIKKDKNAKLTMSTYDLSKVDNVCVEINKLSKYMYTQLLSNKDNFKRFSNMQTSTDRIRYGETGENMDLGSLGYYFDISCDFDYNTDTFWNALNNFVVYKKISNLYQKYKAIGLSIYYPCKTITVQDFNKMRNVVFSPYFLNFIEYLEYQKQGGNIENFKANKWENSSCFYEDTFDFIDYYRLKDTDTKTMQDILSQNPKYTSDGFINNWISNFTNSSKSNPNYNGYYQSGSYYRCLNNTYTHRNISIKKENSTYTSTLDKTSSLYVNSIYNSLFTYKDNSLICLGQNNKANFDVNTGKITSNFNNEWLMLPDGQLLTTYIKENATQTTYSIPVLINNIEMTIKIAENNDLNKKYTVLGVWDASKKSTQGARGYLPLEKGTIITPIYDVYNKNTGNIYTTYGHAYTIQGEYDFFMGQLPNDDFLYAFAIEGLNGEINYSKIK